MNIKGRILTVIVQSCFEALTISSVSAVYYRCIIHLSFRNLINSLRRRDISSWLFPHLKGSEGNFTNKIFLPISKNSEVIILNTKDGSSGET